MIDYYIAHQEDVISKTQFELDKALDRAHILEGYKIVIDNVDEDTSSSKSSKSNLIENQQTHSLKSTARSLSGMEVKFEEESSKSKTVQFFLQIKQKFLNQAY